ncbi:hypothetical protein [Flavobacterium ustbae]|uniref:hypothetical protein n=1 Tax=Flavobacterium ustbae TaxID=2488790 RepID=UPI000F784BFF|nr:hypothetical protein [Flavobacterium ustbae]
MRKIIEKVNTYRQSKNSPQTTSFWDNAAYHKGNLEAYMLTGNEIQNLFGPYMVMPVMTKMYKITNDRQYLDKLYEYLQYSDSIMFNALLNVTNYGVFTLSPK